MKSLSQLVRLLGKMVHCFSVCLICFCYFHSRFRREKSGAIPGTPNSAGSEAQETLGGGLASLADSAGGGLLTAPNNKDIERGSMEFKPQEGEVISGSSEALKVCYFVVSISLEPFRHLYPYTVKVDSSYEPKYDALMLKILNRLVINFTMF